MKAKIGKKYEIESDSNCYTLYKLGKAGADTKTPGAETKTIMGYYSTIEALFNNFPNRALMASDAKNLQDAINEVKQLSADLRAQIEV